MFEVIYPFQWSSDLAAGTEVCLAIPTQYLHLQWR
jgi:hypothetical protein